MDARSLTKIFSFVISITLLTLLFSQINQGDVVTTLSNISPLHFIAGFVLYTCSYVFRAWRFYILLNKEIGINSLFPIVCVHNMMNNLLPARMGELSFIYLLKTEANRTTGEGLGTLIIARIFDFIIITIFFLLLFSIIGNLSSGFFVIIVIGIIFLITMVSLFIGLFFYGNAVIMQLKTLLRFFNVCTFRVGRYISRKCEEIMTCFSTYHNRKNKRHLSVFLLSLAIWSFSYLLFYLIALSMHIELGFIPILFASSFAVFSTVLPIQGIGGFGTMEGGWALGFIMVGLPNEIAISTGFGFHLIVLLYTIILGVSGYLSLFLSRKKRAA